MKLKFGPIFTSDGSKQADISINRKCLVPPIDLFAGIICIALGVGSIARGSFKNGAVAYEKSEFEAMKNIGIIK